MTCEDFQAGLTAFGHGELDPASARAASEHLASCGACADAVLLDRQLTGLLRASAVPAPEALRGQVLAALRAESAQRELPRPRRLVHRHWLAGAAAAGLAVAVAAAALLLVPAPDRSSPLAAAWQAYRAESPIRVVAAAGPAGDRLTAVLGPTAARTPDLGRFGLQARAEGARELAGHLAAVAEYRDPAGRRVALLRWQGELPRSGRPGGGSGAELETTTWRRYASVWWEDDGVVWCLVGTLDPRTLYEVAEHLGGES